MTERPVLTTEQLELNRLKSVEMAFMALLSRYSEGVTVSSLELALPVMQGKHIEVAFLPGSGDFDIRLV